jgi:type VI secretion system protein ImpG
VTRDYFAAELKVLRAAIEQARGNSAKLEQIGRPGEDPDVERLLEGFAFLAGRLQRRMDDGINDMAARLCEILVPSMAYAVPSATMVAFDNRGAAVAARSEAIEAGAAMSSPRVRDGGVECEFRTAARTWLALPATIRSASLEVSHSGKAVLRVGLNVPGDTHAAVFHRTRPLRLYLHGEQSFALHHHLLRRCESIRVADGATRTGIDLAPAVFDPTLAGPPLAGKYRIDPVGFAPDESLLSALSMVAPGLRLMQEFAVLPQKFLFVDVAGLFPALDHIKTPSGYPDKIDLLFRFSDSLGLLPSNDLTSLIRLNVAPVVNLFERGAQPIDVSSGPGEHDLWPQRHRKRSIEIRRVVGVSLSRGMGSPVATVPAFHGFEHASARAIGGPGFYVARPGSGESWSLAYHPPEQATLKGAVLSVQLECTNGDDPPKLGDVVELTPGAEMDNDLTIQTLFRASRPLAAGAEDDAAWKTLAHLASSRRGLGDSESLNALLDLCFRAAREQHARCGGFPVPTVKVLSVVTSRDGVGLIRGLPVPRTTVSVTIEEEGLRSSGEASIFAAILAELYSAYLSPNAFLRLELSLGGGGRKFVWYRAGGRLWVPERREVGASSG